MAPETGRLRAEVGTLRPRVLTEGYVYG